MKIEVYSDDDTVARKAAAVIADDLRAAVTARGRYVMAVSGGRTWLMLRALADEPLPWQQVHVVQVDERVAPPPIPIATSRICARACSRACRCPPITSMPCRSKRRILIARRRNTPRRCGTWLARRQCSISFISASDPMATASLVPGDPALDVTDADVAVAGPYQGAAG